MPQSDALLPWRRVIDNVTLGLEVQGVSRRDARARVAPLLATFGLDEFTRAYPFQLLRRDAPTRGAAADGRPGSVGDAARRAVRRARRPDPNGHAGVARERLGHFRGSVLLITHDIREAVFLSDRVYVLSPRPARVVAEVSVPLTRPRRMDQLGSPRSYAPSARCARRSSRPAPTARGLAGRRPPRLGSSASRIRGTRDEYDQLRDGDQHNVTAPGERERADGAPSERR